MINIGDVIHVTVTGYAPYGIFVKYNDSFMKKRNEKLFIGCQVDQ